MDNRSLYANKIIYLFFAGLTIPHLNKVWYFYVWISKKKYMPRKKIELIPVEVFSVETLTTNVYTLSFEKKFDFVPGQVIAVAVNESHEPRLYSIASGKNENELRILFDINPTGFLTPKLTRLKTGDSILISKPFGEFTPSGEKEWWIATGTGIAPFVSMLKSGYKLPEKLIHGSRTLDHFFYQNLFKKQLGSNYLRFCTAEINEEVISGRLTKWLEEKDHLPNDIKYYLCGNPEMVVNVRDIILSKEVEFENIMAEIYF
jgi:ferredoxin-NADP reductase